MLRNVSKIADSAAGKRILVTDNYYSSVSLSKELLARGVYHVGTVRTNRLGWPDSLAYKNKSRPASIARGTYKVATCNEINGLVAVSWFDTRPVNFLATGCSTKLKVLQRKEKDGSSTTVPCPQLVETYTQAMGGVDRHDQLRLHRYSIQTCTRFRKYYKSLFLSVVDMAIVNGYIVHRHACKAKGLRSPTHYEYLDRLHRQLIEVTAVEFRRSPNAENLATTPLPKGAHSVVQTSEFYKGKRRQYMCKVCSIYNDGNKRTLESSYICVACEQALGGRVALCNCVRRGQLTCSQVWHDTWSNGTAIPSELRKKIRFRKRKRDE